MMLTLHAAPAMTAAFLASLVEFVEALTVVLAVGSVRGWRPALTGTALGLATLGALVAVLGPALTRIPLEAVQLAVGAAGGLLLPASLGALAALVLVILLGVALHRPLARIPENALKFAVGVLLSAFGAFWVGEGIGIDWPGADWVLLALVAGFLAVALAAVPLCRGRRALAVAAD